MGIPPPHDAAAPFSVFVRRSMPYLWGIGVGVAFAGTVLGWDFVAGEPLVVRQVAGDNAAGLAAFRAYLDDGWHWPVLAVPTFGQDGVNVAFSDSIPLLAVTAKLARPAGVAAESWWGGWFAFAYGLQGAGAVFAVRSWGGRSVATELAAPILAVSMPVLLLQTVHPSLSAHGLLLVGWGLAGRAKSGASVAGPLAGLSALTLAAIAVHPYLGAMVGVVALGVVGDAVGRGRLRPLGGLAWFAGLTFAAGLWAIAGGYLDSTGPSEGGYGQYATSVLGPLVPTLSSILADPPAGFEIEPSHPGYSYLGLGVIGLGVASVAIHRRRLVGLVRRNQLLAVAVVALGVWAVSPWIRFATGDPLDIPAALSFRLGSERRAGVAVSVAGLVVAAVALAIVHIPARRRRPHVAGHGQPRGASSCRGGGTSTGFGGFAPAVGVAATAILVGSAIGLVAPEVFGTAMSQFRASGRFAWPAVYGALTFAIAGAAPAQISRSWPAGFGSELSPRPRLLGMLSVVVLAVAVAVQLADTATLRRFAHELLVPGGTERRDYVEVLVELVEVHDRVILGPDFRCTYYPDGVGAFIDVTGAASAAKRPIDRVYSARRPQTEPCSIPQAVDLSDPGALIVLVEPVAVLTDENLDQEVARRCRQRATLNLCSHRWDDVPPETLAFFGPVAD